MSPNSLSTICNVLVSCIISKIIIVLIWLFLLLGFHLLYPEFKFSYPELMSNAGQPYTEILNYPLNIRVHLFDLRYWDNSPVTDGGGKKNPSNQSKDTSALLLAWRFVIFPNIIHISTEGARAVN